MERPAAVLPFQGEEEEGEGQDTLGPLSTHTDMEAQLECIKAMKAHPEMFVSGFDVDDEGIEGPDDPDSPGARFLQATEDGDLNLVMKILSDEEHEDPNLLVHYQDKDGYTALHRAAYSDHPSIIRFLVGKGADVEKVTESGWTPLHSAAHWNSFGAMRELISCGANVNARTAGGQTPLHISSNQRARECMIMLLTNPEIDSEAKNNQGETAKQMAERSGPLAYLFQMCDETINKL